MTNVLAVERGLPPGLWLPRAEEPVEKFLIQNFNNPNHPYEDIVELGMFAVALASFDEERRLGSSLMPTRQDLTELFKAGYGISPFHFRHTYGGYSKLQHELGFYPRDYKPDKEALIERLQWMAEYAVPLGEGHDASEGSVKSYLRWGKKRDLIPSESIVREVLEGDTVILDDIFDVERPRTRDLYTIMDAYAFGARIIRENNGPIGSKDINVIYAGEFKVTPAVLIVTFFGTFNSFWAEFGYTPDSSGMTKENVINAGVRHAIATGDPYITEPIINALSASKRFPSMRAIWHRFDTIADYRAEVEKNYQTFITLQSSLISKGISEEVTKLAGRTFDSSPKFGLQLTSNAETLRLLSGCDEAAQYVRAIVRDGFDLEHDVTRGMQLVDLKKMLRRLGIKSESEVRFVFNLIPRVSYDEVNY